MGWFWAESSRPSRPPAQVHKFASGDGPPPPGCPMQRASDSSARAPFPPKDGPKGPSAASSCPVASPDTPSPTTQQSKSTSSRLNPLNYMPFLSQDRAANQRTTLPTSRTTSSIPRGDSSERWQYPSPQQMYNAMLRKGHDDTPEDAVEAMVAVHNFLNEGAWGEIVGWEVRFAPGLSHGWEICGKGEEDGSKELEAVRWKDGEEPKLTRFMGRPGEMTPKARMLGFMGRMWPAKFAGDPPFDRHDWFVQRTSPGGQRKEVRYVIDYYSGPEEPTGEPVFFLDVRPAIDSPTAACERLIRWGGDVWYRASGASVRQQPDESP